MKSERGLWDARYRSAAMEDGRIVRQNISARAMDVPESIYSILDIGCGTGDTALAWAQRGVEATGLDISAQAIQSAREAACAAGCSENCRFVVGDWNVLDLDAYGWRHAFDMTFSAMGPDMRNPAVLQKMNESSRKYCRLLIFHDGRNALAEMAGQRLGRPLPPSPPSGEEEIRSQLSAYHVLAEDIVCEIAYEAPSERWRSYLYHLFPAREDRPLLDAILEEQGVLTGRMTVQTDAVYRMLTWRV